MTSDSAREGGAINPAQRVDPKMILAKIESFTDEVGHTFNGILQSLNSLQDDIKQLDQLKAVAQVAEQMLSGEHRQFVNIQAKGEVGKLVHAINQTMDNLQQLDKTVHEETGKVPQLAEHLDHITQETESATSQVLEKLDLMIEGSEGQDKSLQELRKISEERLAMDRETRTSIERFLAHLEDAGDNQAVILQEAMEYLALMGEQARVHLAKTETMDKAIAGVSKQAEASMNHAFDIMNVLQFQDITRQKVSKVIGLLKDMQEGLFRLLHIFNIQADVAERMQLTGAQQATQDRILERDALQSDTHATEVEDIIKRFQGE